MVLRNALGAIALDATVTAGNNLLTAIRDAIQGVLKVSASNVVIGPVTMASSGALADGTTDVMGYGSVRVQISGTYNGTLQFQESVDGVNWFSKNLYNTGLGSLTSAQGANVYSGDLGGRYFRVSYQSYTSGSAIVTIAYTTASRSLPGTSVTLNSNLANTIGGVWIGPSNRSPANFNIKTVVGTNASLISASRWLQEITASNPTGTPAFLKVYNKSSSAPVVGTDTPAFVIPIPANSTVVTDWGANGKVMINGIGIAVTGAIGLLDTSSAPAGVVIDGTYV